MFLAAKGRKMVILQKAFEDSWPSGVEKWPFYNRPSIRFGHFRVTARAAEIGARTTFYSLDKRP